MLQPGRPPFVILPRMARFIEKLVRLVRGQALVPEMDRQPAQLAQFRRERLHLFRLRADFAVELQWISNHDPRNGEATA